MADTVKYISYMNSKESLEENGKIFMFENHQTYCMFL
jgi:hypothetical protein